LLLLISELKEILSLVILCYWNTIRKSVNKSPKKFYFVLLWESSYALSLLLCVIKSLLNLELLKNIFKNVLTRLLFVAY